MLQTIFIVALFILAGVPVYRLTRSVAAGAAANLDIAEHPTDIQNAKPAPLDVAAVFAPAPVQFQIRNLDQTVLAGSGPQARFTSRWTTIVPPEGVDLVIQAKWSAPANGDAVPPPAAAKITARFADGRQVEKSFWAAADGTLAETFTVPGTTSPVVP